MADVTKTDRDSPADEPAVRQGDQRLSRAARLARFGLIFSVILLGLALLAPFVLEQYPGPMLLFAELEFRGPFCNRWQAAIDSSIWIGQRKRQAEIADASRHVRSEGAMDLWETPLGRYWAPAGNDEIISILLAQQERKIYGDKERGVQPGDIVLDCGAHIGIYAKYALAAGADLVVAIEPSPRNVECLRRNLADELAAGRVVLYPKGVWDSTTSLTFFENREGGAGDSFVVQGDAPKAVKQIPVTTIDRIAAELRLDRVDFIKADIKGATERMLRGAEGVIQRYHPRMALSTEQAADNLTGVINLVQEIAPRYEFECGPCLMSGREIYTDVIFFR